MNLKGTFQSPTHVFMLLDYACGGELFTLLRREGRFSNDVGLFFAVEIILAFEYLNDYDTSYFNPERDDIYEFFLHKKIILRPLGNTVYIMPPYCISKEELKQVYEAIEQLLDIKEIK